MLLKDSQKLFVCPHCFKKTFKKKGYYYRKISKTYIPRYLCHNCKKHFSTRTCSKTFRQKRPDLNSKIFDYLTSGVSLRRTAKKLRCNYSTVYRKFLWLSERAYQHHLKQNFAVNILQFDEMESIEHTKLKPLTIALAVCDAYKILGVKVGMIPAKGHLSQISRQKYGPRPDQSSLVIKDLLTNLMITPKGKNFIVKSDSKPSYKALVRTAFPDQKHVTHLARANKEKRREMKYTKFEKQIFDPIFATNQRMAKFRDHIKRLTRRSWCTTKKIINLEKNIYLYIADNNGYQLI